MNCTEGRETELLEKMMQRYAGDGTEHRGEIVVTPTQSADEPQTSLVTPPAASTRPKSRGEIAKEKHLERMQRIRGNK